MEQVFPVGATHLSAGAELRQVAEAVAGGEEEGWGAPGEEKREQRGGEEARKGQKRRGVGYQNRDEERKQVRHHVGGKSGQVFQVSPSSPPSRCRRVHVGISAFIHWCRDWSHPPQHRHTKGSSVDLKGHRVSLQRTAH